MTTGLLIVQILNGLQFGILLFLVAAGLTLVFGVMDFINLAHGVQYMLGAYLTSFALAKTGHFALALILGLGGSLLLGFCPGLRAVGRGEDRCAEPDRAMPAPGRGLPRLRARTQQPRPSRS